MSDGEGGGRSLNPQDPDETADHRVTGDDGRPKAVGTPRPVSKAAAAAATADSGSQEERRRRSDGDEAEGAAVAEGEGGSAAKAAAEEETKAGSPKVVCDACPHCDDLCIWQACEACNAKEKGVRERVAAAGPRDGRYTMCQIRRHNREGDVWLVAHGIVYDATEFLEKHPGGKRSILRHAGTDSSMDFDFHSKGAKGLWKDLRIGKVVQCPKDGGGSCAIM